MSWQEYGGEGGDLRSCQAAGSGDPRRARVNENGTPGEPADDYYYVNSTVYDSASRMTSRSLGNGLTQNYTFYNWDAAAQGGRLHYLATGTLQNFTYTYDAVGNILSIADSINSQTQNYEYDDLDRLWHASATGTAEQGGYAQETYDYHTLTGNLQLKGDLTLHYEDASHAHAATSATKEGVTNTYTYDANGNMETRVANGQSHKFHYDAENRLVSVTNLDGTVQVASFEYDADGARIRSVMDGETIVFIGGHCEIANPGQNQIVTMYYLAGGARVAMRKGETLSYLLADHISSTSLTTNESGVRTSELRYKAFGETRFFFGTMPTKYTFTGQYSYTDDPSTQGVTEGFGLMYFNARWMDPSLGRFAQPDSIVPTQTQGTQAWDRYAFVNNNPVRYNDPTGHQIDQGDSGGGATCGGYGQPPCGSSTDSNAAAYQAFGLVLNWFTGSGPQHQDFGPNEPITQEVMQQTGVDEFCNEWAKVGFPDDYSADTTIDNRTEGTLYERITNGIDQAITAHLIDLPLSLLGVEGHSSIPGTIGSLDNITALYQPNGSIKISVSNTMGWGSATRIPGTSFTLLNDTSRGAPGSGLGGTITQTFYWFISDPLHCMNP